MSTPFVRNTSVLRLCATLLAIVGLLAPTGLSPEVVGVRTALAAGAYVTFSPTPIANGQLLNLGGTGYSMQATLAYVDLFPQTNGGCTGNSFSIGSVKLQNGTTVNGQNQAKVGSLQAIPASPSGTGYYVALRDDSPQNVLGCSTNNPAGQDQILKVTSDSPPVVTSPTVVTATSTTLVVSPATVSLGQTVTASYSNAKAGDQLRLRLADNNSAIETRNITATDGQETFTITNVMGDGDYYVYVYRNGEKIAASNKFTVGTAVSAASVDEACPRVLYGVGPSCATIVAQVGPTGPGGFYSVRLFPVGGSDGTDVAAAAMNGANVVTLDTHHQALYGNFELRLFGAPGGPAIASSKPFFLSTAYLEAVTQASPGAQVKVTYRDLVRSGGSDWIDIHTAGAADDEQQGFTTLPAGDASQDGTVTLTMPSGGGPFPFRLIRNAERVAFSAPVSLSLLQMDVKVDPSTASHIASNQARAFWDGAVPSADVFITLNLHSLGDGNYLEWHPLNDPAAITTGPSQGSIPFTLPSAVEDPTGQANVYDFRLYINGQRAATSQWFQVSPVPLVVLGDGVQPGQGIGVEWKGFNPSGNDWVGLYCANHHDGTYLTWQRIDAGPIGTPQDGSAGMTAPGEPGQYQWRLFRNGIKVSGTGGQFTVAGTPPANSGCAARDGTLSALATPETADQQAASIAVRAAFADVVAANAPSAVQPQANPPSGLFRNGQGPITADDVPILQGAPGLVVGLTRYQLTSIPPDQLQYISYAMSVQQISWLTSDQVLGFGFNMSALSDAQQIVMLARGEPGNRLLAGAIREAGSTDLAPVFKNLWPDEISLVDLEVIPTIPSSTLGDLSGDQADALSPAQAAGLTSTQVQSLSFAAREILLRKGLLSDDQVGADPGGRTLESGMASWRALLDNYRPADIRALMAGQDNPAKFVAQLSNSQIGRIGVADYIRALGPQFLTPFQVKALNQSTLTDLGPTTFRASQLRLVDPQVLINATADRHALLARAGTLNPYQLMALGIESIPPDQLAIALVRNPANSAILANKNLDRQLVAQLSQLQVNSIIASGGGNIIASGGGNIIASGGGNVISPNGSNIIASGGGNVISPNGSNIIASGGGNIVSDNGGGIVATGGGNFGASLLPQTGLISQDGGGIINQDGGGIIASGGGNLISQDGGGIIASGGGNVVSHDGGSIIASGGGNVISNDGATLVGNSGGT